MLMESNPVNRNSEMSESRVQLEFMNFYRQQLTVHRESMDRWFGNYLLIIGAPFPLLGGLLQSGLLKQSSDASALPYLGVIGLFFSLVGILFLCMHVSHRINALRYVVQIRSFERALLSTLPDRSPEVKQIDRPRRFGADFWVALVMACINSSWLSVAVYFLFFARLVYVCAAFFVSVAVQILFRHLALRPHDRKLETGASSTQPVSEI